MASAAEAPAHAEGPPSHTLNPPYTGEQQQKMLEALRVPFGPEEIEVRPSVDCEACRASTQIGVCKHHHLVVCAACGRAITEAHTDLSYVGHAYITARLLDVDPLWVWEPLATDAQGLPLVDRHGGMWITLTVAGVTRLGYGDATGKERGTTATKETIGDALRNAGMRFGMALELWTRRPGQDGTDRDFAAGRLEELARWARAGWNSRKDLEAILADATGEGFADKPAPRGQQGTFGEFLGRRLAELPAPAAQGNQQQGSANPGNRPGPDGPRTGESGDAVALEQMVGRVQQHWSKPGVLAQDLTALRRAGWQDHYTQAPPEWGGQSMRLEDMVTERLAELADNDSPGADEGEAA